MTPRGLIDYLKDFLEEGLQEIKIYEAVWIIKNNRIKNKEKIKEKLEKKCNEESDKRRRK